MACWGRTANCTSSRCGSLMCHPFLGKSPGAGEPKVHPEPQQGAMLMASVRSHFIHTSRASGTSSDHPSPSGLGRQHEDRSYGSCLLSTSVVPGTAKFSMVVTSLGPQDNL